MNKRIMFKHMEHTPVLDQFVQDHLVKIEKLLSGEREPIFLEVVIEGAPSHAHHQVDIRLKTPHYELVAKHEGPDMYAEIDRVTETMAREIVKAKEKWEHKLRTDDTFKSA